MKESKPLLFALKTGVILAAVSITVVLISYTFTSYFENRKTHTSLPVFDKSSQIRFVIDPGHGGEDAGAVASDGTLEKDLNLEISTLLAAILELNGNEVVLTRSDDRLLYDHFGDLTDYTGQKKVYDLKNRLKIAEENENSIYVGIHMNKFPEEKYSGMQIYYSKDNELSQKLAADVKDAVKLNLQPQNRREIKKGDSSIYILNNASIPAILIECGFMSNNGELELLKSEAYQKQMCITLFSALVKHAS